MVLSPYLLQAAPDVDRVEQELEALVGEPPVHADAAE